MRQLKIKIENLVFMHAGHDDSADPTKELLAQNMPLLLNTAWSLSALDIESSVSRPLQRMKQNKKLFQNILQLKHARVFFASPLAFQPLTPRCQVNRASKYVTRDVSVPWQTRFKRARALLILGKVRCLQRRRCNCAATSAIIFFPALHLCNILHRSSPRLVRHTAARRRMLMPAWTPLRQ